MSRLPSAEVTDLAYDLLVAQRFLIEVESHLAERGISVEDPTTSLVLGLVLTDEKVRGRVDAEASHLLGTVNLPLVASSASSNARNELIADRWRSIGTEHLQGAREAASLYRDRVFENIARETVRDRANGAEFTLADAEKLAFDAVVQAARPWGDALQAGVIRP